MQKKALLYFCAVFITGSTCCYSQVSTYNFTAYSGVYTDLTGGTIAPLTQDPISTYPGDDGYSNGLPIGFTFMYDGLNYTTVSVSTNGWATFGNNIVSAAISNNLFAGGTRPLIAPLWDDIGMANPTDLSYSTTGSSPNRIMTIQWNNVKWSFTSGNPVCMAFQVKLYETSNTIEFIYKQLPGVITSAGASIGLAGSGNGAGNFLSLSSSGSSPTVSSTIETSTINTRPATGQVYQFIPPPICVSPLTLPYQQGFNSSTATLFYCWNKVVITPGVTQPDLSLISSGTTPTCSPSENSGMLRFNASNATTGTRIRAIPPYFNTTGVSSVDVSFSMYENNSGSAGVSNNDFVVLQYSITGGASWINVDTNYRYNQNLSANGSANRWYKRYFTLPPNAGNRTNLMIGLLFVSAAGNDLYLDDLNVSASTPIISTGNCSDMATVTNVCGQNRFRVTSSNGGPVVELKPGNNDLGTVNVKYYVNTTTVRKDNQNVYYLDRNYEIKTTTQPASPIPVKFYFTTAELNALKSVNILANLSNLMATRVNGSPGDLCSSAFMNTNTNTKVLPTSIYGDYANGHYVQLFPPGFSQFFIYEDAINRVLPPSELLFAASRRDEANFLQWQAIIESGIKEYYVERSLDGINWIRIGTVAARDIAGSVYDYADHSPGSGNNYYRIIQRSISGRERYSVIRLVMDDQLDITLLPIPAGDMITLFYNNSIRDNSILEIKNVEGQVVQTIKITHIPGNPKKDLDISRLQRGIYLLTLTSGARIITKKFCKI